MENKKIIEGFGLFVLLLVLVTFGLTFINLAFIPMCMLMSSLLLFCICYYFKDDVDKKIMIYILFVIGVMLIIGSLIYTGMRFM